MATVTLGQTKIPTVKIPQNADLPLVLVVSGGSWDYATVTWTASLRTGFAYESPTIITDITQVLNSENEIITVSDITATGATVTTLLKERSVSQMQPFASYVFELRMYENNSPVVVGQLKIKINPGVLL